MIWKNEKSWHNGGIRPIFSQMGKNGIIGLISLARRSMEAHNLFV